MMSSEEKIMELRAALAALLRQTADPDPVHPAFIEARQKAAEIYRATD